MDQYSDGYDVGDIPVPVEAVRCLAGGTAERRGKTSVIQQALNDFSLETKETVSQDVCAFE